VTTALDPDPYLLPLPTPTAPVVPAHLVVPMHAHLNALYSDPVRPLAPLSENPSASKRGHPLAPMPGHLPGRNPAGSLEHDQR
jgi:hypothetical protein